MRALAFILLAAPVSAQVMVDETRLPTPWIEVIEDVTGDGQFERLRATPFTEDYDIISIELGVDAHFTTPLLFPIWQNRTGGPGIEVTSDTSFLIRTGCFACGRYHSAYETKIAWRDGAFLVAGFTSTSIDRIFAASVTCDLNMLSGRGEIRVDDQVLETIAAPDRILLAAWDGENPRECQAAWAYESDAFLEDWIKDRDETGQ